MSIVYETPRQRGTHRYQVQIKVFTAEYGWEWVDALEEPYRFLWTAKISARGYYKSGTDARVLDRRS